MSTLAYIIARDPININKSEYSPKKTHLFKETSKFLIMSHNLNYILIPSNVFVFIKHTYHRVHFPISTLSFPQAISQRKSLKGAFDKNQWTSKLRLITTILFVLLSCYQLLTIKPVAFLDKMSLICILIWINSKITFYSIEDIKREMKNINEYWIFLCCYILSCYCRQFNRTERNW